MNIVFFGTDKFAINSLEAIYNSKHKIVSIVTAPDAKRGRGLKETFTDIKRFALNYRLNILQPRDPNSNTFIEILKELSADLFAVVSYGKILSLELINLPKKFSINLHPSLLPRYRGPAPINWAILNGEDETGISIIRLNKYTDSGEIISQKRLVINPYDDAISLSEKLSKEGAKLLVNTLDKIDEGRVSFITQDEGLATYAPMLKKSDGLINWKRPAEFIHNQVRAFLNWPSAYTYLNGKLLKIFKTKIEPEIADNTKPAGTILEIKKDNILAQTGKDPIAIYELQVEGSKRLPVKEFLLGHCINPGEILGE